MSLSITNLIEQSGQVMQSLQTGMQQKLELIRQTQELGAATKADIKAASDNEALVEGTAIQAKLDTQERVLKTGETFRTNIDRANNVYTALAAASEQAWQAQQQAKAKVDAKQRVSLFEDPLGWIAGRLTVNQDIAEHNAANENRQAANQRIQELNALTDSTARVQAHFAQTVTQQTKSAAMQNIALRANVELRKVDRENIRMNMEAVEEASKLPIQQLSMMFQLKSAQNAQEGLDFQRQSQARQERRLALAEAAAAAREAKTDAEKNNLESTIHQAIDLGRAARGLPALTGMQIKHLMPLITQKNSAGIPAEFQFDYQHGSKILLNGGSNKGVKLVNSPLELVALRKNNIELNLPAAQTEVLTVIERTVQRSANSKGMQMLDKKDVAGATKLHTAELEREFDSQLRGAQIGTGKSLYSIPALNDLAATQPDVAANPVYQKVLKVRLDAGEKFEDGSKVVAAVASALKKGEISYTEALRANEIFVRAVEINNAQRGFKVLAVPEAKSFNANIKGKDFDITRPEALGQAIQSQLRPTISTSGFGVRDVPIVGGTATALGATQAVIENAWNGMFDPTKK